MIYLIAFLAAWLVGGYFFTRWFISGLPAGKWGDTGRPANPLFIHLASPGMALVVAIIYLFCGIDFVLKKISPKFSMGTVRKFYGVGR